MAAGSVSPINASSDLARTVSSIAATSRGEGPIWRRSKVVAGSACFALVIVGASRLSRVGLIGRGIHQSGEFSRVGNAQLEEPSLARGVGIDQRGIGT